MNRRNDEIEDLYGLSPMQQGMLFHSLYAPESGVYVVQIVCTVRGKLDTAVLEQSWQRVVDRHAILRTAFFWEGLDKPVQMVFKKAKVVLNLEDLRDLAGSQQQQLDDYLKADRRLGIDFHEAPLMRLALLQLSDEEYQFIWTHHHILVDGWCMSVLIDELFTSYNRLIRGEDTSLEPAASYGSYIEWLQRKDLSTAETFWRKNLQGFTSPTPLPGDHSAACLAELEPSNAELEFRIPGSLINRLQRLARDHQLTINTIFQGAWAILLSRYSGKDDVVFGATVSGRPPEMEGVERIMGLFINTLPVRVRIAPSESLLTWLQQLQEQQAEARGYEYSPLVEVHGWSEVPRQCPLFECLYCFENYPFKLFAATQSGGLSRGVEVGEIYGLEQTNFPLTITISSPREFQESRVPSKDEDANHDVVMRIMYDRNRFDASAVVRFQVHFQNLLEGISARPESPLAQVSMLSPAEREQLLREWNQTSCDFPTVFLHELFAEQARQRPEATALIYNDEQMSYGELERRANQLAQQLRKLGVGPEAVVAVLMERSSEMVISLLAILKAGGAYLPLDPTYPAERLAFILENAGARVVLSQRQFGQILLGREAQVLFVDEAAEAMAGSELPNIDSGVTAENVAYVIYTSGSSGEPKGVMNTHGGICNRLLWMQETYGLTTSDSVLQKTPFTFDVSVWEFFWPLIAGARLVVARPEGHRDPAYLVDLIKAGEITTMHFVPSLLQSFLATPGVENCTSLRRVFSSGEALSRSIEQEFFKRVGCELHNLYGPTEAAVDVSFWECERFGEREQVPIGKPIANTELYILNAELEPSPIGVNGEIYIGGVGLARGYLQRAGLTAEKFVPDPFSGRAGARLYRTGDQGRYLADGNIEYRGRLDQQVKLRGYRIELGEIETVLGRHEAVAQCVVSVRETESGDQRLVGYVVRESGQEATVAELREYLDERLPEYMVPAQWVMLEELPLTTSGKVDRRALPAPAQSELLGEQYLAPRTATEEIVASIWAKVLELERVGINDNFFDLGGHSLVATQVISRAREAFAVELPVRSLFENPTVSSMSRRIEAQRLAGSEVVAPPLLPRDGTSEEEIPLSFAQQRLWFLDQLEPNNPFYNVSAGVRLSGELNIEALERTLSEVVRRHEVLRTSFSTVAREPRQVISAATAIKLPLEDLSHLPAEEREQEAKRRAAEEVREPFDLSRGPLLRARLLRLAADEHVLLVTMHHIVSDGWSMGVLVREVSALYQAYCAGAESPLAELAIQYADFAVWQRQWLSGDVLEEQLSYWREQLRDLSTLELPTDRVRPAVQSYRGASMGFALGQEETAALKQLSRREGATLFMVLLAAFQVLLSRYSGQSEVVVGTDIANRNQAETEELIGFFVNQLVLRTELNGTTSFVELLQRVREVCLQAYAHQDVPFEKLVEELQPERDLSRSPLFQVKFIFQNAPGGTLQLGSLRLSSAGGEGRTAKYDLLLALTESSEGIRGIFEYSTDLFDAGTIERLQEHFQELVRAITAAPELPLTQVSMLTPAKREQLLREWNQTTSFAPTHCLHELFAEQARQRPEATALLYEGEQMSYGELERRANQLAHHLQRLGVGPEVLVGICLERTPQLVVALLAVLKAGGAYLPLDPAYPPERLSFMLEDAAVTVLLSERELLTRLAPEVEHCVCLDEEWEQIAIENETAPECAAVPENLAYVIYTSGSTGQPKGVMITHANVWRLFQATAMQWACGADDVWALFHSYAFDFSVWELWGALLHGGRLVVVPYWSSRTPAAMLELLRAQQVTVLCQTPSAFQQLMQEAGWDDELAVRAVIFGGEALEAERLGEWPEQHAGVQLVNMYGITETTVHVTYSEVGREEVQRRRAGGVGSVIGRGLADLEVYLLDEQMQPVPVGVPGEICIGGAGLGRGYLQRAGLTAARFIPDPFSGRAGDRLYRSGDLGRYQANGNIEYRGRLDQQVKVRGFRIELGEIEATLGQHEAVAQCVVNVRETESGNKRLVGYVVWESGQETTATELRQYLSERLPEYMVPGQWVVLDKLPLTASGKVDRKALPALEQGELASEQYVAPRTATEEIVAGIWAEVLELEQVGMQDNFFRLGGHSLLATQVVLKTRDVFDISLPLRSIFDAPTIAAWASVVDQLQSEKTSTDISRIGITPQGYKTIDQLMLEEMDQSLSSQKSESIR